MRTCNILGSVILAATVLIASTLITGCRSEDVDAGGVDLVNLFSVSDDPSDPVQHMRYAIYEKYNVPVFFNDTLSSKQIGTDIYGKPIMNHETLDLNWSFDSYNRSVKYSFEYLTDDVEKLNALKVVEGYLSKCSKPMLPFSVLLVKGFGINPEPNGGVPKYFHVGYRTLLMHGIENVRDDAEIAQMGQTIINNMVFTRVKSNSTLVAKFAAVSSVPGYYGIYFKEVDTPVMDEWLGLDGKVKSWYINANSLCYGVPYEVFEGDPDFVDRLIFLGYSEEEAKQALHDVLMELGSFGFIRGWKQTSALAPDTPEEDLEYFINTILYLGSEKFLERYGDAPLVLEKFNIIHDYMTDVLKLEI